MPETTPLDHGTPLDYGTPLNHLALFIPSLIGGGAQRVMVNLARGFADRGVQVDLVLAMKEGPYLAQVPERVRLVDLKARRLLFSVPALVRYLQRERPQVMLSTIRGANILAPLARRLARVPTRIVVREPNTLTLYSGNKPTLKERGLLQLMRWMYSNADRVIANSSDTKKDLVQYGVAEPSRIRVLPNPLVTADLLHRGTRSPEHPWFSSGKTSENVPVVLGVGRLEKQKGFSILLHAFKKVREKRPVRLIVLGEGSERSRLEKMTAQLGLEACVDLPGFVDNPYAFMRWAEVFVLSSLWEGFGNVLVEALAMGTKVVATDCPGGPAAILKHGKVGPLVSPADPVALAEGIATVLDREDVGADVRKKRAQDFSIESVTVDYLNVLQELVASR